MSRQTGVSKKAVILYSSMTGNTRKLGTLLQEYLEIEGISADLIDVNRTDEESALHSVEAADLLLIGTSTRYADMTGKTEQLVLKIIDMDLEGKIGGAFGSFGWSGEGIEVLQDLLLKSNMDVLTTASIIKSSGVNDVQFPLRTRFLPEDETRRIIRRSANFISGNLLNAS